jgi:hypothetical protein
LTYHVVPGTVYSIGLSDGQMVKTVEGKELAVKIDNGKTLLKTSRKASITMMTVSRFLKAIHFYIYNQSLYFQFEVNVQIYMY